VEVGGALMAESERIRQLWRDVLIAQALFPSPFSVLWLRMATMPERVKAFAPFDMARVKSLMERP
jgi:hypothetical protein